MRMQRDAYVLLVARAFTASLFIFSGLEKIVDYSGAVAYAANHGIPSPALLMPFAIALELVSGMLVLAGWRTRLGALILAAWTLWTGPWFHRFWSAPPALWQFMIDDFFHHLVMAGGLLYVYVFGPGAIALDAARSKVTSEPPSRIAP